MKHLTLNRFRRDEEGAITLFIIAMFMLMVVAGGMAVDFMRHESERVRFQDAMDRGVLSAASLRQVDDFGVEYNDPKDVVTSYLRAEGYDVDSADMAIAVRTPLTNTVSSRQVDAAAEYTVNTFFLRLINIPTLTVAAYSSAAVEYSRVELSLVLDISGSMGSSGSGGLTKMQNMKVAAVNFVNQVITDDNDDRTTMSIIPFSATVNAGLQIAEEYTGLNAWHNYSYCFDFARPDDGDPLTSGNDYLTTAMAPATVYQQAQHYSYDGSTRYWCPRDVNKIVPLSNNRNLLAYTINNLQEELYTSQWMGVKWGAGLLDPSFNPVTLALINKSQTIPNFDSDGNAISGTQTVPTVENIFNDRPTQFVDGANKYLVLMSDGDNTMHTQVNPLMYNQTGSVSWRTQANADWWNRRNSSYTQYGWGNIQGDCNRWNRSGNCTRYDNLFGLYNIPHSSGIPQPYRNFNGYGLTSGSQDYDVAFHVDPDEGDTLQNEICTAAKTLGIHIYTIGFSINAPYVAPGTILSPETVDALSNSSYRAYKTLYKCATNGADFYFASNADELEQAFSAIASNVARLKLLD